MIFCGPAWKLIFDIQLLGIRLKKKSVCPSPNECTVKHATVNELYFIQIKFPFTFGDYVHFSKLAKLCNTHKFLEGESICWFAENTSSTREFRLITRNWGCFVVFIIFAAVFGRRNMLLFSVSFPDIKLINFYLTNSQSQSPNKICMEGRYTLFCLVLQFWRRAWGNNRNPKSLFFSICSQKYSG